ncbi:hypothetical protein JA1_001026 [Spathaspora sp. JA1]|nr:hypothetical protein JA1_001026 [Spathaspora sp. JA1]
MSTDRKSGKFGFRISSIFNQPNATSPTKRTHPQQQPPGIPPQHQQSLQSPNRPTVNNQQPLSRRTITPTSSSITPTATTAAPPPAPFNPSKIVPQRSITSQYTPPRSPASPIRRKQPPALAEGDILDSNEMLYFNTPNIVKTSPSPAAAATSAASPAELSDLVVDSETSSMETSTKSLDQRKSADSGINYDMIANLEQEIDQFLNISGGGDAFTDSPRGGGLVNIQYDTTDSSSTSSSNRPLKSSSLGQESDFESVGKSVSDGPYPVDYPVENSNIQLPLSTDGEYFESDQTLSENPFQSTSRSSTPDQLRLKKSSSENSPIVQRQEPQQQPQVQPRPTSMNKSMSESNTRRQPSTPSSSSQFTRSPIAQVQPQRAIVTTPPFSSESASLNLYKSNTVNTFGTLNSKSHRRQSSSISSIMSSNSYKNVNLAQLKKTLNLKPGEGERSNYVWTIRRSAGTAFNENGPSRWKLPLGILPVDKTALYENSNGRYLRLGGSAASRKKTSGVELKHGHLKPRLLAAEIDEDDDDNGLQLSSNTPPISATTSNSGGGLIKQSSVSRENSIARTITDSTQSMEELDVVSDKRDSMSTSSSVSDKLAFVTGFYQHRGYRDEDKEDFKDNVSTDIDTSNTMVTMNDYGQSFSDLTDMDGYEERPRLYLANPDSDTDSE